MYRAGAWITVVSLIIGIVVWLWMPGDSAADDSAAALKDHITISLEEEQRQPSVADLPTVEPVRKKKEAYRVPVIGLSAVWDDGTADAKALISVDAAAFRWFHQGEEVAVGYILYRVKHESILLHDKAHYAYYEIPLGAPGAAGTAADEVEAAETESEPEADREAFPDPDLPAEAEEVVDEAGEVSEMVTVDEK